MFGSVFKDMSGRGYECVLCVGPHLRSEIKGHGLKEMHEANEKLSGWPLRVIQQTVVAKDLKKVHMKNSMEKYEN